MDDLDAAVAYPVLGRGGGKITRLRWALGNQLHARRSSHLGGQDLLDAFRARARQRVVVTKRKRPYRLVVGMTLDEHTTRNFFERCADGMQRLAVARIERCACGREQLGRDKRDPGLRSVLLDADPAARLLVREQLSQRRSEGDASGRGGRCCGGALRADGGESGVDRIRLAVEAVFEEYER